MSDEIDPDRDFYSSADPLFFLRASLALDQAKQKRPSFRLTNEEDDEAIQNHPLVDSINLNFDSSLDVHLHWLRLQQSEAALTLLCAGNPHGPFYRFARLMSFDKWNRVLDDLAGGHVPEKLRIRHRGELLTFAQWIRFKLLGHMGDVDLNEFHDIEQFVREEAKRLSNRNLINAVKHGARVSPTSGTFRIGVNSGSLNDIFSIKGVRWGSWILGSNQETYVVGLEGIDGNADLPRTVFGALLCKAIVDVRLARLKKLADFQAHFPSNLMAEQVSNKLELKITYQLSPSQKREDV